MKLFKFKIFKFSSILQRNFSSSKDTQKSTTCDLRECRAEVVGKSDLCAITCDISQPCVVIIGAGMAGLSAAHRLNQCGITNIKILEASDRPGGRIKTCCLCETVVEMGSQWISGASIANNILNLAAQEGLLNAPLKRVKDNENIYLTSDGKAIDFNIAGKARSTFKTLEAKAINLLYSNKPIPKISLGKFFDRLIKKELRKLPETERYDAARVLYGLENSLKARVGDELDNLTSTALSNLNELPGGRVQVPVGLGGVLGPLIRDLPKCALIYCSPVHSIRWGTACSGFPRAVVRCSNGKDYSADYVIVTVPLGVLKKTSTSFFCPGLPSKKVTAIENLGVGLVNKIFLEYKTPFWSGNSRTLHLAWSPQELKENKHWVTGLNGFELLPGSNKVLGATVSGKQAKEMENISDAELINDLTHVLRKFLSDASLPKPISVMRSNWATNCHFYGAFSFISKDSNVGDIFNLMEPLPNNCEDMPPILLFAGEHTSPKYFATMHGARESGIREAHRIIQLTKKLGGPPKLDTSCRACL